MVDELKKALKSKHNLLIFFFDKDIPVLAPYAIFQEKI